MMKEKDNLWCRVLTAKYRDINRRRAEKFVKGLIFWKRFREEWNIGDGQRVKFWNNKWVRSENFSIRYNK
ncbi:hypothetical protein CR513_33978, partial [Mucuna pruriens]